MEDNSSFFRGVQFASGRATRMAALIGLSCTIAGCVLFAPKVVTYTGVRVVDYHDQRELPVPTLAALDELVG
jgi:hypothetical protein